MREEKLFELACSRVKLPENFISLDYRKETDLLAIRFSNKKRYYSRVDMPEGIIYDYDSKDNLVCVEILDFYPVLPGEIDDEPAAKIWVEEGIVKTRRAAQRKRRRRTIKRSCCSQCGQPKHYICLEHHRQKKRAFFKRFPNRLRYHTKKFCFKLAEKLGLIQRGNSTL
jgi:hypothetical protein